MSSPRYNFLLVSVVMLGVPLSALAFDPPTRSERTSTTPAVAQSAPRPDTLTDLACTVCDFRPTLDLLLKPPANLRAGLSPAVSTEVEAAERSPFSANAAANRVAALTTLQFRDNQPLINRLKRAQAWPLLTFWDSSAATLYLGLDKNGEPGVHLRQKRSDRGSVMPRGHLVLMASPTAASESVAPEAPLASR